MRDIVDRKSVAPKLAASIYLKALDYDAYLSFDDQDIVSAPFTDACFYPKGFTIRIEKQGRRVELVVQGIAFGFCISDGRMMVTHEEFREAAADGDINAHIELESNSWFELREIKEDNEVYDLGFEEGYIEHDIVSAVEIALNYVYDN